MTARTPQAERLVTLLGPVVHGQGFDLEDVSVTAAGRRSVIRVVVDADGGVDLDAVAVVARAVSDTLDGTENGANGAAFAGPYVLEVSSPGVDRPLTEPRHWRRAVGRLVAVPINGSASVTGRIQFADADHVTLVVDAEQSDYPYSDLGAGRVQVEFNRPDNGSAPTDDADQDDYEPDDDNDAEQEV